MAVAVTHRLHLPAWKSPAPVEIIAASFSAIVMEFPNDPGNGWYPTSPG